MVRNAGGQDYVLSAIANSSANNFSVTVADSGGSSGDALAYIPAFSASVTNSSGDISAIAITAPGGTSGSCQLNSIKLFANAQQSTPLSITLPAGTQEGAGTFGSKAGINPVVMSGLDVPGTGNSANFTPTQQFSLGSNYNILKVNGVDRFVSILLKVTI